FSGQSVTGARVGFLVVALVGCAAAYALGRALIGVAAGLVAAALIAVLPPFPAEAMRVDADVPAVSLSLVALALAAWSTKRPWPWLAGAAGFAPAAAVSVQLDALLAVLPLIALLAVGHASRRIVGAVLAGSAAVTVAFLVGYAGVLDDLWASVVTFHRDARSYASPVPNGHVLGHFLDFRTPGAWLV